MQSHLVPDDVVSHAATTANGKELQILIILSECSISWSECQLCMNEQAVSMTYMIAEIAKIPKLCCASIASAVCTFSYAVYQALMSSQLDSMLVPGCLAARCPGKYVLTCCTVADIYQHFM